MTEIWNGHALRTSIDYGAEGTTPFSVTVEIEVAAPAHLLVRKRPRLEWTGQRFERIALPNVDPSLEVRGDDPAFAQRLFDDRVAAATLPLALKSGESVEVSPDKVSVHRRVVDEAGDDAAAAARAMAMAVVSALELPPPAAPST